MSADQQFIDLLREAPDSQLDSSMQPLITCWDNPPRAIQILEVLDKSVHAGLCSDFVVTVLDIMLKEALKREDTTLDELAKTAIWRKE